MDESTRSGMQGRACWLIKVFYASLMTRRERDSVTYHFFIIRKCWPHYLLALHRADNSQDVCRLW